MRDKKIEGIKCRKCLQEIPFTLQDILAGKKNEHEDCVPVKQRKTRTKKS